MSANKNASGGVAAPTTGNDQNPTPYERSVMTNSTSRVKYRYTDYARGLADGISATLASAAVAIFTWKILTLLTETGVN